MPRCFVIQPFDRGPFDKRYDDVFVPAIEKAALEPYRVDRDPTASVLIETIERCIQDSEVCLADISLDNPNVWYEVGFAIASGKEVVLVCSEERATTFPFDVRHRNILAYTTHSPRDFEKLGNDITARLKAIARKAKAITELSPIKPMKGLSAHEMACLVLLMENRLTPETGTYPYSITEDMKKAGFTGVAATLALEGLRKKRLIELASDQDFDGNERELYRVTGEGVEWCLENEAKFEMRREPRRNGNQGSSRRDFSESDDDIPF